MRVTRRGGQCRQTDVADMSSVARLEASGGSVRASAALPGIVRSCIAPRFAQCRSYVTPRGARSRWSRMECSRCGVTIRGRRRRRPASTGTNAVSGKSTLHEQVGSRCARTFERAALACGCKARRSSTAGQCRSRSRGRGWPAEHASAGEDCEILDRRVDARENVRRQRWLPRRVPGPRQPTDGSHSNAGLRCDCDRSLAGCTCRQGVPR